MTEQQTGGPAQGDRVDRFFDSIRAGGVFRRRDHRWLGGVCSGLATRLDVDPVLIRIAAVFAGMFFGIGITVYLVAWALLPDDAGAIHAERAWRERHPGSIVLVVITLISVLDVGDGPGGRGQDGPGGLLGAALAVGLWFLITKRTSPPAIPGGSGGAGNAGGAAGAPDGGTAAGQPSYRFPAGGRPADPGAYPQDRRPGDPRPCDGTPGATPWTPPRPAYATPASRRRRTGGPFVVLLAAGLSLLAYQTAHAAAVAANASGSARLIGVAAIVAVLGLTLLLLGLAGRRGGLISLVAMVLAVGLTGISVGAAQLDFDPAAGYGEARWRPAAASELQDRYEWSAGEAELDLSHLDAASLAGLRTSVDVGMGQLTVILPRDADATVTTSVVRGRLDWEDDRNATHREDASAATLDRTLTFAGGTGKTPLTIDAGVRLGELRIEQR